MPPIIVPRGGNYIWVNGESHAARVVGVVLGETREETKIQITWNVEEEHQSAGGSAVIPWEDLTIKPTSGNRGMKKRPDDMDHPQRILDGHEDTDW